MHSDSGRNDSIWMRGIQGATRAPLTEGRAVDICVIGAGISGLSTAYLLAREGQSVVVLDDGPIGGGETSRTSGHLASAIDDRYYELEKLHGAEGARIAAQSHAAAIDLIESIAGDEGIECDFRRVDGYLFLPPGDGPEILEEELAAVRRAGLAVERVAHPPVDSYDFGSALRFANQAEFHVMKYMLGLAQAFEKLGGTIHTGTHVDNIDKGRPLRIKTSSGHLISASHAVVSTNVPMNDRVVMHTKQAAYRTYIVAFQVDKGLVPHLLMWDTPDPYHYIRICSATEEGKEWLLVGGEDHKTGQAPADQDEPFQKLEEWARERFPVEGTKTMRWSGQVIEPNDSLAFMGRNPLDDEHVYIATGDSGNGLTHGTLGARVIADLILGRDNPWAQLYAPRRRRLRAASEFARENLNVAAQYSDLVTSGDLDSIEAIPRGEGAVVREGMHKIAAYRDEAGEVHRHSAICPHLGCVVEWNGVEGSWDCPCHGSRFDKVDGHVLNGPALGGLAESDADPATASTKRQTQPGRSQISR